MHAIHHATQQLAWRQPLERSLVAAYRGLEIIEYAARAMVFLDPDLASPHWREPQRLAAQARADLAFAPSIRWPLDLPPPALAIADKDVDDVTDALARLVDALLLAFAEMTAEAVDPEDRAARHAAAIRTAALQQALHRPLPE